MASSNPPAGAGSGHGQGIQRQDLQAAISKAVELRALHAALLQGGAAVSPAAAAVLRHPAAAASPSLSRVAYQSSAPEDYPIFTASYEEDTLPGYHHKRSLSHTWSATGLEEEGKDDESVLYVHKSGNKLSSFNPEHVCSAVEHLPNKSSCINQISLYQAASRIDSLKSSSRRTSSGESKTLTTSKPATIVGKAEDEQKNLKNAINTVPLQNQPLSIQLHTKNRGAVLSWLLPKSKKKPKPDMSPNTKEPENMSQLLKEWGVFSLESLKKELLEANESRDVALSEVSEMKSSLGGLQEKLVNLEGYCEQLKKALKQAMHSKASHVLDKANLSKRTKSVDGSKDDLMPVSHEVMVEGFLQIVSEARLSVKQFCKTLIKQIEESDEDLENKLNLLLQPYQITLSNKTSRGVVYHLEALINQSLYQDFENSVFQKNGCPKNLDPQQECRENFSSFVALRNLSWNEVLQKGTKCYSDEFSKFCDQRMNCVVSLLDWSRPWPEELLQCFFVASKCIWLLHLLAFSFNPPLVILRVGEGRNFDPLYMDEIPLERQRMQGNASVKVMVMPGFYVHDKVLKCRVLCRQ